MSFFFIKLFSKVWKIEATFFFHSLLNSFILIYFEFKLVNDMLHADYCYCLALLLHISHHNNNQLRKNTSRKASVWRLCPLQTCYKGSTLTYRKTLNVQSVVNQ